MSEAQPVGPAQPNGVALDPDDDLPRQPRWVWAVAAILTLLVVGGAIAAIAISSAATDRSGAQRVLEDYVAAVAAGDSETANELGRVDTEASWAALAASEALAHAETIAETDISGFRIEGTDRAEGRVGFTVDGSRFDEPVVMLRDDEGWYVSAGLLFEVPTAYFDAPAFGLRGFEGSIDPAGVQLRAYPGVYEPVALSDFFRVVGAPEFAVTPDAYFAEEPSLEPTRAYFDAVQREIERWFDACAEKRTVGELADCGIEVDDYSVPYDAEVEAVRVLSYPTLDGWEYFAPSLLEDGRFEVELAEPLRGPRGGGSTSTVSASNWPMTVEVEVDGDDLRVGLY